jgi:hypothetical protein
MQKKLPAKQMTHRGRKQTLVIKNILIFIVSMESQWRDNTKLFM